MMLESPLEEKVILVVDDEPDILETVEEELDMCIVVNIFRIVPVYKVIVKSW